MNNSSKLLLLFLLTLFIYTTFNTSSSISAKDDDDDNDFADKNLIQICCTWGYELADGSLTYSIDNNEDDDHQDSVRSAIESWNSDLTGIRLVETDSNEDIKISFKDDGEKVAGKTVNYFDRFGFIRQSHITVSEESYDRDFNSAQIEQIALHELGHALGLDHANFRGNLMTERVDVGSTSISSCEIQAVNLANEWKVNNADEIYLPKEKYIEC